MIRPGPASVARPTIRSRVPRPCRAAVTAAAALLTVAALLGPAAGPLAAAPMTGRTAIGLETGLWKLTGGGRDYSNLDQELGLQVRRGLGGEWSLEAAIAYGWVRPGVATRGEDAGWTTTSGSGLYTTMLRPRIGVLRHFLPEAPVTPHLGLSLGLLSWKVRNQRGLDDFGLLPDGPVLSGLDEDGRRQDLQATDVLLTLSAGADWAMSDGMALSAGVRWSWLPGNDLDNIGYSASWGVDEVDANDQLVEGFLGLAFLFGGDDDDDDGIVDRLDACPHAPEDFDGFEDSDGCPDLDNDGDGIPDRADVCPDEPEDPDGFADADGCPDPDNDGDGVPDHLDRCPDTPEDLDGFEDADGCPDPDNDGDGVVDELDRCPETPEGAQVQADGCPPPPPVLARDLVLEDVQFESNSARMLPGSEASIRELAATLRANPEVRIEVRGHTDSLGPAEVNRDLSLRRATAVRQALIDLGIAPSRVTAIGYGEDYPIEDNSTAAGRARNRRVEIHRTD